MIDVHIKKWNGHYVSCSVRGHAGYSRPGTDIVCAAVSSLVYMLESALPDLSRSPVYVGESTALPDKSVVCIAEPDAASDTIMRAFELGIQNVAFSYPENVTLHLS